MCGLKWVPGRASKVAMSKWGISSSQQFPVFSEFIKLSYFLLLRNISPDTKASWKVWLDIFFSCFVVVRCKVHVHINLDSELWLLLKVNCIGELYHQKDMVCSYAWDHSKNLLWALHTFRECLRMTLRENGVEMANTAQESQKGQSLRN